MVLDHGVALPPPVRGRIQVDSAARAAAADDFGHIVHRTPERVLLPASGHDVALTVRWAAQRGRRLAAQGRRHSLYGRDQVADGVVVDMTRLHAVGPVQDGRVTVDAGATWREVVAATLSRGLIPPALPDYLDLTVGGTLVVGGVGAGMTRSGATIDNVADLQVVTGRGEELACSPSRNADLFDAVRGGLGQVGVITRATLTLVPAAQLVRRFLLSYPDLATMLRDARLLAGHGRFDVVQGAILPLPTGGWAFRLDAAAGFSGEAPDHRALLAGLSDDRSRLDVTTLPYASYLARLDLLEQALRTSGEWMYPHPWLTTFVGDSAVESVVERELAVLTPADLGPLGQVVLSAFPRCAVRSPMLRLPEDGLCYAFNVVRLPAAADAGRTGRFLTANRAAYERIRATGGTLYPVAALPMSPGDWRAHVGPAFERFAAVVERCDPDRVLTPGYEVFGDDVDVGDRRGAEGT